MALIFEDITVLENLESLSQFVQVGLPPVNIWVGGKQVPDKIEGKYSVWVVFKFSNFLLVSAICLELLIREDDVNCTLCHTWAWPIWPCCYLVPYCITSVCSFTGISKGDCQGSHTKQRPYYYILSVFHYLHTHGLSVASSDCSGIIPSKPKCSLVGRASSSFPSS